MFRCESEGYETVVYGAFDGVTTWTNHAYVNLGPLHQEVVSAHEERHLRLQKGTLWGALLMLLGLGGDHQRLPALADGCRRTHEAYATYLSVAHVVDGMTTIEDNPLYLDYWRAGATLAGAVGDGPATLATLEYLFHLAMSPAALADVPLNGDAGPLVGHSPDERLTSITALLAGDARLADAIVSAVADEAGVDDTQDRIAALLGAHGLPTLSTSQQLVHATRLMEEFNVTSLTHRVTVTDRSRATALTDQLDYQQHEVLHVHREPVHLEIGPPPMDDDQAPHPLTGFVTDDPQLGAHVWGVLLSSAVLNRQFAIDGPLEDRYWGLLAIDRRDVPPRAQLWPLDDSPAVVTEACARAGIASVLMTTMSTLSNPGARFPFAAGAPVFVLVDLPALPFLRGLQDEHTAVRWSHAEVVGDVALHMIVLSLEGPDPMYFVMARSAHTVRSTGEWLRRSDGFHNESELEHQVHAYLVALARHLIGTFWAFAATRNLGPQSDGAGPRPAG